MHNISYLLFLISRAKRGISYLARRSGAISYFLSLALRALRALRGGDKKRPRVSGAFFQVILARVEACCHAAIWFVPPCLVSGQRLGGVPGVSEIFGPMCCPADE